MKKVSFEQLEQKKLVQFVQQHFNFNCFTQEIASPSVSYFIRQPVVFSLFLSLSLPPPFLHNLLCILEFPVSPSMKNDMVLACQ